MAGKSSKNPLLSGAGISFPFENFTNNTLLVPVPQNDHLIPEEIEADSFLGQEPQRSGSTSSFKTLPSLAASISKSFSSQSLSGTNSQPEPNLRSNFPSEPLLNSPVPEFTKNFTGTSSTAKPVPIYAESFRQEFNQPPPKPILNNNLLESSISQATKPPSSQTVQSPTPRQTTHLPPPPVLFTNQISSDFSAPTVLIPTPAPSTIAQNINTNQNLGNFSTSIFTPVTTSPFFSSGQSSNHTTSSVVFTPVSLPLVPDSSANFIQNSNPLQSEYLPPRSISSESKSQFPNQQFQTSSHNFSNFSSPNIFTSAPGDQSSSTQNSSPYVPSAPPAQSFFSYFSSSKSTQDNDTAPSPTLTKPAISSPPLSNSPVTQVSPPPTLPPQSVREAPTHPPPSGGHQNSYRLSNIKRPTYTRPPELPVTPMAAMPSSMTSAPLPQSQSTSLFTPSPSLPQSASVFTPTPPQSTSPSFLPQSQSASLFGPSNASPSDTTDSPAVIDTPAIPAVLTTTSTACVSTPQMPEYKFPSHGQATSNQASVLPPSFASLAQGNTYRPVYHHWFFKKVVEGKVVWNPFNMPDSLALEEAFTSSTISPETKVATDGARYDVEVLRRRRHAAYWEEEPSEVRRCSWFVKGSMDLRYVPYEENVATMLEEEYRIASSTNEWNRQVSLPDGEVIIIHSPNAISHHARSSSPDVWGNSPQMQQKPKVVKRGLDEFDIGEGEPEKVDHLLFLVHGIGKFCDLKFRPVNEVVDDFRIISLQLLQSHFKEAVEAGQVGRVEVLPVSWHQALHSESIDQRLNNITLQSIPRLRHFTNDTLLDILFYTSPVFCETIVQAVGNEMNRLYNLFLSRNPSFLGGVSLGGHSLGSLILFDMLCNQLPEPKPSERASNSAPATPTSEEPECGAEEEVKTLGCLKSQQARLSRSVSYLTIGTAGTGQPFIRYPQLTFKPKAFFALGSPIGMFITVRGIESLGEDFALPTCPMFFNIFHPLDPVAFRIESLINSDFCKYTPVLIPHHKGRKRMHLELKDTLEHVGAALKQRLMESFKSTWNSVYQTMFNTRTDHRTIEQEVNQVIENEILQSCSEDSNKQQAPTSNNPEPDLKMGQLNGGRRVDYVLQEAPLESFNEYIFALSSHVCYWESEDTMLMILKEIYSTMGVTPDSQVVHQILPYEAPDGSSSTPHYVALPSAPEGLGMDPTAPVSDNINIGPPPISGFFRE